MHGRHDAADPLYGLYQEKFGFSELTVTVVYAVHAVGVIAVLLPAGNVSDTVGRRPVLLWGPGFAAASAVCFLCATALGRLDAGRLLSGLSAGLFTGAATACVLELAPHGGASRATFVATAANMGGLGCGPLLAGVLARYADWPLYLPFAVHLALMACSAIVLLGLPETVRKRRPLSTDGRDGPACPRRYGRSSDRRRLPRPPGNGTAVGHEAHPGREPLRHVASARERRHRWRTTVLLALRPPPSALLSCGYSGTVGEWLPNRKNALLGDWGT